MKMSRWNDAPTRFWNKVCKSGKDSCWPWKGAREFLGYGRFQSGGKRWKAHRYAYFLTHGPIKDGKCVCHHCDNPPCCNPDHLFLGTHQDNMADMFRKNRRKTPRGEDSATHKLTESTVKEILKDRRSGMSQPALSRKYSIPEPTIAHITQGTNWAHLGHTEPKWDRTKYRGSINKASVLTEENVKAIREMYATGGWSYSRLSKVFLVGPMTISHVVRRETWTHV